VNPAIETSGLRKQFGKTTTIRMLTTLIKPDAGSARVLYYRER